MNAAKKINKLPLNGDIFPRWLLWLMGIGLVFFYLLQLKNGKFELHDFRVYYGAAKAWLSGTDVYEVRFGLSSGVYKYSPTALLPFAPFTLLHFKLAASIFYFIVAGGIMLTLKFLFELCKTNFPSIFSTKTGLALFIALITIATHILRELELGNINMLLLLIFLIALKYIISKKHWQAGALIGLGIILKPHFIVLLPLLVIRKQFKVLRYSVIFTLIISLLPFVLMGYSEGASLYSDWFTAMSKHNSDLVYISGPEKQSTNTLYSIFYNSIGNLFLNKPASWLNIFLLGACAFGILLFIMHNARNKFNTQRTIILEYFLVLAAIPLITVTDTEHFLLSLPIVMILVHLMMKKMRPLVLLISISILLMYGGNWHDLVGKNLSEWITVNGILGWGNLLLILWTLYLMNGRLKDERDDK